MRHAIVAALWLALLTVERCVGLTCFKCTIQPPGAHTNQTPQLCSTFDHSSTYHVDCPYSTFCMKRTFEHELQQGRKVKVSERGCAPQKRNQQVYRDGSWQVENKIEGDVYHSGCVQDEGLGIRSPTEYCYCQTNLCNSAESTSRRELQADTMAIISILNILKYVQSLR